MFLNLNDPASILAWWQVNPDRHNGYLEQKLRLSPEFGQTIREAQRRIAGDANLQGLLARSVSDRLQQERLQAERRSSMSSVEMLRRDLATAV